MQYAIEVEGLKISYTRQKADVVRQRVLLIHGTGCDSRVFKDLSSQLASDHDVVVVDLPGHGRSEGNGFRGVADYAAYCAGLVSALNWENCVVAGHSLGGGIALAMALYHQELVGALMMIDSGARLRVRPELIEATRRVAEGKQKSEVNPRVGFSEKTAEEIVSSIRNITSETKPSVTVKDWIADDTCDFMARIGKIHLPTLAICGREDELTPLKYHEHLAEQMPNCSLSIIEDAGHWSFVEQPTKFLEAIRPFLDNLS